MIKEFGDILTDVLLRLLLLVRLVAVLGIRWWLTESLVNDSFTVIL